MYSAHVSRHLLRVAGAVLLSVGAPQLASAVSYPPGPGGTCPDTLQISNIQDMTSPCHPVAADTVLGVQGIVTGFDTTPSSYGFYIQVRNVPAWAGIKVFTGSTDYRAAPHSLALCDRVAVYGRVQEFPALSGETELEGPDGAVATDDLLVRRISILQTLPSCVVTTTSALNWVPSSSATTAEPLEGMLVRVRGPLRVGRTTSGLGVGANSFLVVDNIVCSPGSVGPCDSVAVDGLALTHVDVPTVGAVLDSVQGILSQMTISGISSYRILLRSSEDLFIHLPPPTGVVFQSPDAFLAGHTIAYHAITPVTVTLVQDSDSQQVDLRRANMTIAVESAMYGNFFHFKILSASGSLGPCTYQGSPIDSAQFALVSNGTGSLNNVTGSLFAEMRVSVTAPGKPPVMVTLYSSGLRQSPTQFLLRLDGNATAPNLNLNLNLVPLLTGNVRLFELIGLAGLGGWWLLTSRRRRTRVLPT